MGLTGLWVCFMVLSAVSCLHQLSCVESSVTGYRLIRGCDSSIGSVGSSSASVGGCVAWNVSFFEATGQDWSPQTVQEGQRLVCVICCTERCLSLPSVWVEDVSSLVSLSIGVGASFGLLQCVSCLCLKMGKKRRRWEGGPSVAQCPKLATLYKCALSSRLLCWNARMRDEWYISPTSACRIGVL